MDALKPVFYASQSWPATSPFFFSANTLCLKPLFLFSPHLISPSLNQTHNLHGRSFKAQHKPPSPLPWPKLQSSTQATSLAAWVYCPMTLSFSLSLCFLLFPFSFLFFVFIHSCAFVCAWWFSDYGPAIVVKRHSGGSTIVVMRHDGDVGLIWWVLWADLVGFTGWFGGSRWWLWSSGSWVWFGGWVGQC